jgi:hypothetical protein
MRKELTVGATLLVSTSDGDEEDEVTRVVVNAVAAGICIVETVRNGRVIVMLGGNSSIMGSYPDCRY